MIAEKGPIDVEVACQLALDSLEGTPSFRERDLMRERGGAKQQQMACQRVVAVQATHCILSGCLAIPTWSPHPFGVGAGI